MARPHALTRSIHAHAVRAAGLILCLGLISCAAPHGRPSLLAALGLGCDGHPAYAAAARANAASLGTLTWSPFGRPETGWAIYQLKLRREIGSSCAPDSTGFAARLARWQAARGLRPDGVLDPPSFERIKAGWQASRPFVRLRALGVCPDPPPDGDLAVLPADETYPGKRLLMRREALGALRRLLSAAWTDVPGAAAGPNRLVVFSAYRSPAYDAARCARDGDCDGVGRAVCSSHRTGLAIDLMLGAAPGYAVDSADGPNRLYQTRRPAYRWLVDNAARFGFVNYPFEPWHWEWTGAPPNAR